MALVLAGSHANPIDTLTAALLSAIFARLPADGRARAACVCRGWRELISDPALWLRLDLSREGGVSCYVDDAALHAASARAQGRLEALDVTGCVNVRQLALHRAVVANSATLLELRTLSFSFEVSIDFQFRLEEAEALLVAAPALRVVEVDLDCGSGVVRRLLCRAPPFQPLLVQTLGLDWDEEDDLSQLFPAVMAEVRAHVTLKQLSLSCATIPEGLGGRFVELTIDAALALRLTSLRLFSCGLTPVAVPALARLLSSTTLMRLSIDNQTRGPIEPIVLLDAAAAALLASALRANCTLRELELSNVRLWEDTSGAASIFGALTGHASLRVIDITLNRVETEGEREVAGALLGALVAANSSTLVDLGLSSCNLRDVGLRHLVAALPLNTHLRQLGLVHANLSAGFLEQQMLPALRANTSLRQLYVRDWLGIGEPPADVAEVQRLLREATNLVEVRADPEAAAGSE